MQKVTVQVGYLDGSLKNITFTGKLLIIRQELDNVGDDSRGTDYSLYRVKKGYRVFEKRWIKIKGKQKQNYSKLSGVFTKEELLEKFAVLANEAGMIETVDIDTKQKSTQEDKKTFLVAVDGDSKKAWVLSYTLENVEKLIELGKYLVDQEDVPEDIKDDFGRVIPQFKTVDVNP